MAGGSGTRLWPLSRKNKPKQLLPLVHGRSLLQLSYDRLRAILPADRIYVVTGAAYAQSVYENLPELPRENLLGEPMGRDTANAVGFAAAVLVKRDPEAVMCIVTADHVIQPVEKFHDALRLAFSVVEQQANALVTFGIVPSFGHVGLGYIHRGEPLALKNVGKGAYRVLAFKEKPDKPTADRYVETGRYYWNSGSFVWRCDTVLRELARHLPAAHEGLSKIAAAWDTPGQGEVLQQTYGTLPKISIDYAVMEPSSQGKGQAQVVVVEMPIEWLDVGSWPALAEILNTDEQDNAIQSELCLLVDSDDNILISSDPAAFDLDDRAVGHHCDSYARRNAGMRKRDSERVKEMVNRVKDRFGERFL